MADKEIGWKDWIIGCLWVVTLALAGLGFSSISTSIEKIAINQAKANEKMEKHATDQAAWLVEYERQRAMIWRVIDRVCGYQTERLRKQGITPQYAPPADK